MNENIIYSTDKRFKIGDMFTVKTNLRSDVIRIKQGRCFKIDFIPDMGKNCWIYRCKTKTGHMFYLDHIDLIKQGKISVFEDTMLSNFNK